MAAQRRYVGLGALGALAGVVAVTSPAWACSPNASIFYPGHVQAAPVPPGGVVTVEGVLFNGPDTKEQGGPVEILWNSMVGTPLASASGLSFSVQVPIPATAVPGETYYINAVQRSVADPRVSWKSSVPIEIAAPAPTSPVVTPPVVVTPPTETSPEATDTGVETPPLVAPPVLSPPVLAPPVLSPPVLSPPVLSLGGQGSPGGVMAPRPSSPRGATSPASGSGSITGAVVGNAAELRSARTGAGAEPKASVKVGPGGETDAALVPANPATAWTVQPSSAPAPSLFEPTDASDTRPSPGVPIGAGVFGVGLMAILGAGVVAGQRRLALASRRR